MLDKIKGCLFYKRNEIKEIKESINDLKNINDEIRMILQDKNIINSNKEDTLSKDEKVRYCRYIISTIRTRGQNFRRKFFTIFLAVAGLIICISLLDKSQEYTIINCVPFIFIQNMENSYNDIIFATAIPLVIFIITDSNSRIINSRFENETRINEIIKILMPLYNEHYLDNDDNKDVKEYYEMLLNPNKNTSKKRNDWPDRNIKSESKLYDKIQRIIHCIKKHIKLLNMRYRSKYKK